MTKYYYLKFLILILFTFLLTNSTLAITCQSGEQAEYFLSTYVASTPQQVCSDHASAPVGTSEPPPNSYDLWFHDYRGVTLNLPHDSGEYTCEYHYSRSTYNGTTSLETTNIISGTQGIGERCVTEVIVEPSECDGSVTGQSFTSTETPSSTICDTNSGCSFTRNSVAISIGTNDFTYTYTGTDQACDSSSSDYPSDAQDNIADETCLSSNYDEYCYDTTMDTNCGTLNGVYTCLDDIPENDCIFLAGSSSYVCDGTPTQASLPDQVYPYGQPDTPTTELTYETTDTVTGDTIANNTSFFNTGATGDSQTDGLTNTGDDVGNSALTNAKLDEINLSLDGIEGQLEQANDSLDNIEDYFTGDCQGADCANDIPEYSQADGVASTQSYVNQLSSVPIIAAFQNLTPTVSSGSCPIATMSFINSTVTLDSHCSLLDSIANILRIIMTGFFVWKGMEIILSA